jgi:nucleotide-binding universal stress UspA family protein
MIRFPYTQADGAAAAHAPVPLDEPAAIASAEGAVVVGVDGSSRGHDAIALGGLLAEMLDCDLRVVGMDPGRHRGARALVLTTSESVRRIQHAVACPIVLAPRGYASRRPAIRYVGCGFDTSAASRAAWREALEITRAARAELHVYAVREHHAFGIADAPLLGSDLSDVDQELGHFLYRELIELVASAGSDVCVEPVMASGSPETVLREAAETLDLLVIGASRHGTVGSFLLGSVARRLMHDARCPLMMVPTGLPPTV